MKTTITLLLLCGALLSPISAHAQNAQFPITDEQAAVPRAGLYSPPPYRDSLLSLHKDLIQIPSILGGGSEDKVASFLVNHLESLGYAAQLQLVPKNKDVPADIKRYNVLAWPGAHSVTNLMRSRKPRVLVTSHIDVVPPYIPYDINVKHARDIGPDTVISGRGSVDAKASVAAQITAVEQLLADGSIHEEDLMLVFVVGEETGGDGMVHFSDMLQEQGAGFEAAIFGEPTENKLACGHKGIMSGWVQARGKAGHSGYPELGKSATELLMRALVKILDADLGSSERFGNTTFNVGRLTGGVAANVIAKEASAMVSVRVAAGNYTTGPSIVNEKVENILKEVDDEAFDLDWHYSYGPVECNCDVEGNGPSLPPLRRTGASTANTY